MTIKHIELIVKNLKKSQVLDSFTDKQYNI